jgi:hypothetical protein
MDELGDYRSEGGRPSNGIFRAKADQRLTARCDCFG